MLGVFFYILRTPPAPYLCCEPPAHMDCSPARYTCAGLKHLRWVCHKAGTGTPALTIHRATPHPMRTPKPNLQSMKEADPVWDLSLSSWCGPHGQATENLGQPPRGLGQLEPGKLLFSSELICKMCRGTGLVSLPPGSCYKATSLPWQAAKSQSSGVSMQAERSEEYKSGEARQYQVASPEADLQRIQATVFSWTVFNQAYSTVPSLRISKNQWPSSEIVT